MEKLGSGNKRIFARERREFYSFTRSSALTDTTLSLESMEDFLKGSSQRNEGNVSRKGAKQKHAKSAQHSTA
jgi:hypothetical protein